MSDILALSQLFVSLFSANELRRFLAYDPIISALPGETASLNELAFAAASLLKRHGMIDNALFMRILSMYPARSGDISHVMNSVGVVGEDIAMTFVRTPVFRPRFAVITALALEAEAMLSQLTDLAEKTLDSGTIIRTGILRGVGGEAEVSLVISGVGNQKAAALTMEIGQNLRPFGLLFVGIAGAIKDVALGDVIAATKVYNYASGKVATIGKGPQARCIFLIRPDLGNSTHRMEQRARAEAISGRWLMRRKLAPKGDPKAHVGPIAAGEVVVASTRSATYKFLREKYSDALAVEMEGRGFLEGAHIQHAEAIVIRGISDRIDKKSVSDEKGWQLAAADNAAAFAAEVMLNVR